MTTWHKWYRGGLLVFLTMLFFCMPVYGAEKIKFGVMGPMKFTRGEHTWMGAQIAAEEINAKGGISVGGVRREVELVKGDTNEFVSISDAVSTAKKLALVDKVDFFTGISQTEACLAVQEVMADHRIIWVNGGGIAHQEVTARVTKEYDRYKYFFRTHTSSIELGQTFFALVNLGASKIREELGIATPRVALLIEKAKWADPIVENAKLMFPKMGMEIVGLWRPAQMATDLTAELTAIKAAGAHIIFHITAAANGAVVGKQWGELQIPAALIGFNSEAQSQKYWKATGGLANYETVYHFIGRARISEKTIPFYDKYTKKFNETPGQDAMTYDAIWVIKEAVERAGTLKSDAVIAEIEKTDTPAAFASRLVFNPKEEWSGRPDKAHSAKWGPGYLTYVGFQWQDGKMMVVWPNGEPVLGNEKWRGTRYEGTVNYKLPPWMVRYWKK